MSNSNFNYVILSKHDDFKKSLGNILHEKVSPEIRIQYFINNETELVILDLHSRDSVKELKQHFTMTKVYSVPFIIILGVEKRLRDYDDLYLKGLEDLLEPIRLLTHVSGTKYCRYFSFLDEIPKFISFIKKINDHIGKHGMSLKSKNPLQGITDIEELQSKIYSPISQHFLEEAGRYSIPAYRRKKRYEGYHEKEGVDSLLAVQFYDLAVAYVKYRSQAKDQNVEDIFNVLLIENRPERPIKELNELKKSKRLSSGETDLIFCLKLIEKLFGENYKFWIYPKEADYQSLKTSLNAILESDDPEKIEDLETEILRKVRPIHGPATDEDNRSGKLSFKNLDLILIDIFLSEQAALSGIDFLRVFTLLYPEIPAFILSGSEDTEVIGETIKGKADYYILKKNIFSLPFIYYDYINELGSLINYIKKPELKRNLIGNIRYWRFKKDFLWYGDKCYHMVNHSFNHVENDWNIANHIVPYLLDALKNQDKSLSDEEIYAFCMAIWLHDIGHKGNEHYGEPHEIRDLHGLVSAELVMKHPEYYGCYGYVDGEASPYRWANFGQTKTAPQLIMERMATLEAAGHMFEEKHKKERKSTDDGDKSAFCFYDKIHKLTILEKICLLCIYHKSNFPLDADDVREIIEKGKRIPVDCYYDKNKNTAPIHLKSIADTVNDANLLKLAALFRFIDGIDINQNRVGDRTEEGIKKRTIERDLKYQILKLKNEVNRICYIYLKDTGKERRFFTLFFERAIKNIKEERRISNDLKNEQERFLDTLRIDFNLENYYMLSEYIEFLCVQDGHFGLHNSIDSVEINTLPPDSAGNGKLRFEIKYKTHKDKKYLNSKDKVEIKERGEKEGKTIRDHLLGDCEEKEGKKANIRKNDGYVRRELNNGKKYLKDWFDLKNTKIYLWYQDENVIDEEFPEKNDFIDKEYTEK